MAFKPLNPRRIAVAFAALAAGYVVIMFPLGCARSIADRLLLHPSTDERATYGANERWVDAPTGRVQVFTAGSPSAMGVEPERYVLRVMGNASRAEREATPIAARWGDVPTEVWCANYPGFGRSEGVARVGSLVPAVEAVWEAMGEEADGRPMYLDVDSMGSAVGLSIAASRKADLPAAGIVVKNPPPLRPLILERFGWWNLWLVAGPVALSVPAELGSIENAKQLHVPAVFIRATADGLIPPSFQERISDAYAGRKRVVLLDGADHATELTEDEEHSIRRAIDAMTRGFRENADEGDAPVAGGAGMVRP